VFVCVKLPGVILRCDHTWAAWEGPVAYSAALFALQLLAVCHTGDRIPGRSTWGSPTTNKHPWTPGGSERTAFCALSFACSLDSAGLFTRRISS
jgi:hypothetical protein